LHRFINGLPINRKITVKWNVVQISGQVSFPKFFNDQHPKFHIKISNRISLILVFIPLLCSSHHKFLNIVSLWHSLSLSKISKVVANKTLKECSFKVNFVIEILCVTHYYMGHAATKPDKVNIGITKDFRDQ